MRVKHLWFTVIALMSLVMPATPVIAIDLGELQAIPGSYPPYVFRLTIIFSRHGPSDIPAVTVRQPRDVLSLVKGNLLELRLPSLTDVELEINQGGQTFNRLLLKSELQAARARLETAITPVHHQLAAVKDRQGPAAEPKPLPSTAAEPQDQAQLEREMQEIRQQIYSLVARVTPWEGTSILTRPDQGRTVVPVFTLTLWGGVTIGLASFCIGYFMRRKAIDHQQQQVLEASIRRLRGQLTSGEVALPSGQRAELLGHQLDGLGPVRVMRRVRISQKTRRRIRARASRDNDVVTGVGVVGQTQTSARLSHSKRFSPAEVVEALGNLRRELTNLQRRLPHVSSPESSHAGSA